jgi:hypothetical protein
MRNNLPKKKPFLYRVTVYMRQHCTDGSFRFCRWRAHIEAFSEDSGPEALSTQGQYFALQVFYEILKHIASELSANCCRTITITRYRKSPKAHERYLHARGHHDSLPYDNELCATGPDWAAVSRYDQPGDLHTWRSIYG